MLKDIDTRVLFSLIFTVIASALGICGYIAYKSPKRIGKTVAKLNFSLIPPLLGNLIIIGTDNKYLAYFGYYIFLIGMDLVMLNAMLFAAQDCKITEEVQHHIPKGNYVLLIIDAVQLLLNTLFGHAFEVEPALVQEKIYYRLVPHWGQTLHRVVDYMIFFEILLIYIVMVYRMPKVSRGRYRAILSAFTLVGVWQGFYIFSRTPVDRSMIGFGLFGLLVFYFSMYFRPLRLLDRMLSNIASDMAQALFVFDQGGKCIWANDKGIKLAGVNPFTLESVSKNLEYIFGSLEHEEGSWCDDKVIGFGDEAKYYSLEKRTFSDESNKVSGSFLTIRDTTEEQLRLKRELYNSAHDSLTGLYTKQYLYECIRKKLDSVSDAQYIVVFVDVKNFKIVNDIFSTAFGDKALQQIADWIRNHMTDECVYGRLAGDTFGVLTPKASFKTEELEKELSAFIVRDGNVEYHILIHLGIYEINETDTEVSVMFDRAHLALTTINEDYQTHIAYYDNKLRDKVLWDQQISADVHDAIEKMQICPYLQPIADNNGKVVGAEALARWIHPVHGFMPPGSFIPVFEKNGMIVDVDRHIWRCACRTLSEWRAEGIDLFISINISPKDFYFIDVTSELKKLVEEYGIEPAKLRIEITETVMMANAEDRMKILDELRRSGFIVEMDDFGSGYSSLNMLKDMPVDVLKIDMKFLSSSDDDERAQTIIKNVITLSKDLGIESLTEGVETKQQYERLSDMGCKMFQGYYFAKPMPCEEFKEFVFK